jgi:hypothetical protein
MLPEFYHLIKKFFLKKDCKNIGEINEPEKKEF